MRIMTDEVPDLSDVAFALVGRQLAVVGGVFEGDDVRVPLRDEPGEACLGGFDVRGREDVFDCNEADFLELLDVRSGEIVRRPRGAVRLPAAVHAAGDLIGTEVGEAHRTKLYHAACGFAGHGPWKLGRRWFAKPQAAVRGESAPRRRASEVAGGPRPLEVEPADAAVAVEDLAGEVQAGDFARSHRAVVDLVQRHAAGGDLGV